MCCKTLPENLTQRQEHDLVAYMCVSHSAEYITEVSLASICMSCMAMSTLLPEPPQCTGEQVVWFVHVC